MEGFSFIPRSWYNDVMHKQDIIPYTAGIIDGEGYISLVPYSHCKTYNPVVKITSTDKVLTDFLLKNFGGYVHKRTFKNNLWKNAYCWEQRNKKLVKKFLSLFKDYILIKREHAELVIEYCDTPIQKVHPRYKSFDPKAQERLHEIYKNLRHLNKRGKPPAETK